MDPMTAYGLGTTIFGIGSQMFNDSPEFNPLTGDYGVHGDYRYDAERDFGQDTARQNMERYGFQGIYQNYLQGQTDRMKKDEMMRIQKIASGLVPGQSSLRGGLASQGIGGSTSNVLARQQREQGMSKALDFAGQQAEESNARLDQQLFGATQANEAMRYGSSQDYMKAIGMGTQAGNQASEFNQKMAFGRDSFNAQQLLARDQFNAQGEFGEQKASSDKWNSIFGDIAGIGGSIFGQGLAREFGGFGSNGGYDTGAGDMFSLNKIGRDPYAGLNIGSRIDPTDIIPNSSYRRANYYRP